MLAAASLVACVRTASSESAAPTPSVTAAAQSIAQRAPATAMAHAAQAAPTLPPAPRMSVTLLPASGAGAGAGATASPGGPKIYAVVTTPSVVHTGESVSWNVRTSADVVSVTAHVSAYTLPLQQRSPGHFFLGFTIPAGVPPVFHGTYTLELIARTHSGSSATRDVPMIFE